MKLEGADELRDRLAALPTAFEPIARNWAVDAVKLMQSRVNSPSGRLRRSFQGNASARAGLVFADYRVTFQDKGTKAHGPRNKKAMKWGDGGNTIFAKKVRGVRKRPFIRRSAREAMKANPMADEIIKAWNAAGGRSSKYTLGNITAQRRRREARAARRVA